MTLGKVTPSKYFINNIQLENVTFYKDLGIIFENNLLFNKHIDYICKKAYFSLNSIFRCITTKSPRELLNAYKIYCRPILEYASIIWSPFSKVSKFRSLIDQIERVQRLINSFDRNVTLIYYSTYIYTCPLIVMLLLYIILRIFIRVR